MAYSNRRRRSSRASNRISATAALTQYRCTLCSLSFECQRSISNHKRGVLHLLNLSRASNLELQNMDEEESVDHASTRGVGLGMSADSIGENNYDIDEDMIPVLPESPTDTTNIIHHYPNLISIPCPPSLCLGLPRSRPSVEEESISTRTFSPLSNRNYDTNTSQGTAHLNRHRAIVAVNTWNDDEFVIDTEENEILLPSSVAPAGNAVLDSDLSHGDNAEVTGGLTNHVNTGKVWKVPIELQEACDNRVLTNFENVALDLHQILDKSGVPLILFDKIMKWAKRSSTTGEFNFEHDPITSRSVFVSKMITMFRPVSPQTVVLELEVPEKLLTRKLPENFKEEDYELTRSTANVNFWDFEKQLADLLADPDIFRCLDNLNVSHESPYSPYFGPTDGPVDDFHTAEWFSDTIDLYRTKYGFDDNRDFFLPIILTIDKTSVTGNDRFGLEPMLFTLALIKRKIRNDSKSWRCLGFVPDIERNSRQNKKRMEGIDKERPGRNLRNYHKCLDAIIKSVIAYQKKTNVRQQDFDYSNDSMIMRLGETFSNRRLFCTVSIFIGDGKNADAFTGRKHHLGAFNDIRIDTHHISIFYDHSKRHGGIPADAIELLAQQKQDKLKKKGRNSNSNDNTNDDQANAAPTDQANAALTNEISEVQPSLFCQYL
jgi:hypothetical protein